MRAIWVVVGMLLTCGIAEAQVFRATHSYDDGGSQGSGASLQERYPGSLQSLPYGHTEGFDPGLVQHALTMPSVQYAMQQMAAQGYVRRPDADAGGTVAGYSVAVIAYEKPGVPVSEAFPAITVRTHPYYINNVLKWRPVTQVTGGLFRDSSGVLLPSLADDPVIVTADATPLDAEIRRAMALETGVHDPGAAPGSWAYTTYDYVGYVPDPYEWGRMSAGEERYWQQYMGSMGLSISVSALSYGYRWTLPPGPTSGWPGGLYAMAVAAFSAHYYFMMTNPPPTPGGR